MDTSSLQGLELALIVGVVGWFYLREHANLKRLKEERDARDGASGEHPARDSAPDRT